jgi:hypothetical protein
VDPISGNAAHQDEESESDSEGDDGGEAAKGDAGGNANLAVQDAMGDLPTSNSYSFVVIDPSSLSSPFSQLKPRLQNATNLALLRLFNDLDIVPCLSVPEGKRRYKGSLGISPSARLVDWHGLQEVYSGRLIWVYDAKSNVDACARLITQRPTTYGLAT